MFFYFFFQCAHKNRNNELTNLICLGPALGKRERFLAIAGIASILSFFCLTWRRSNPVFVIVTTRKVSLGGRSLAGGGYQTFGGWNVENSHETWEVVPPGLASSENSICFFACGSLRDCRCSGSLPNESAIVEHYFWANLRIDGGITPGIPRLHLMYDG